MNLYIYKYNNYYNRIVKQENTLLEYGEPIHRLLNCKDFTPGDAVNTVHIFGSAGNNYDGSGDYLIVADEYNSILSRWFIIETDFTRQGQWKITLRRDLVVDYYDAIVNAPTFIEKATLNADDPLVFNSENMTVNQIKTDEKLLKDKSGCGWLVGYYDRKKETISGTVPTNNFTNATLVPYNTIEEWPLYQYITNSAIAPESTGIVKFNCAIGALMNPSFFRYETNIKNGNSSRYSIGTTQVQLQLARAYFPESETNAELKSSYINFGLDKLNTAPYTNTLTQEEINELLSFNGKTIVTALGEYYDVSISSNTQTKTISIDSGALFNNLSQIVKNAGYIGTPNSSTFKYTFTSTYYNVSLSLNESLATEYNITNVRLKTLDAAYDIFAIPFGEVNIKDNMGNTLLTTNKDISIAAARSIQIALQSECYDLQLLPYCPIQELITDNAEMTVTNPSQYSFIVDNSAETPRNVGIIFNVPKSIFSFDIYDITIPTTQTAIEKKLNNECDKWRLSSPNYSNYFDFSVEKNNGIQFFNIDCSYKPYNPYIHINPNFTNLYGKDFNDVRGLVCGGDYSITQITDAWIQYELQNKNYQATFDRQIQNMEVQNNIIRTQEKWAAGAGAFQGAAAGALAGSMITPGIGTAVGAISGGAASLVGGLADIQLNEQLRAEALDYTRDMFGYQLGNIQALPQTISKISAFNNNNKIFPILEYYTCTDREKEALANKIAWNGMSVGVIGIIADYIGNSWTYNNIESKGYIKGRIIRVENLEDEFHLIKEISNEIYKGVYF